MFLWTLLPAVVGAAAPAEVSDSPSPVDLLREEPSETEDIFCLTSDFSGQSSLEKLRVLLERGDAPDEEDPEGNTPLLYMCRPLEMDYRYRTDPLFQQAVDQSIVELLHHGADALHENRQGCNALFFLQSKPQLMLRLEKEDLLPRELAIRIPHEEGALRRYIQLRVAQASCTVHEESLSYLSRRYCAPAYERVLALVQRYLSAESARRVPPGMLKDCLAFLRLASPEQAHRFVNGLSLWEHGEHFLEEIPELLLRSLDELNWEVDPQKLRRALGKLDSMLPQSPDDMIDCNASLPIGHLLEMLMRREGDAITPLLEHYADSPDPSMAYAALRLLLQHRQLPLPESASLRDFYRTEGGGEALTEAQNLLLKSVLMDEAVREATLEKLDAQTLALAGSFFRRLGLRPQAELLEQLQEGGELVVGEEGLRLISKRYDELPGMPPRVVLSRYILENPQLFSLLHS